ncbi:hypothetical protein A9Q81_01930 [Gammaproteobacteria bacterium 42_54_T18]|nr:hypothetical protein A9Q81_01930 [Gammaproteobacteria bacterium 42_54_T18]
MIFKRGRKWAKLLALLVLCASNAQAELAIIVNNDNVTNDITVEEVVSIFLGKSHTLPDGTKVVPIDQREGEQEREVFYRELVRKSQSQLNSYWSRIIFAGKGQPPFTVNDGIEVIEFISGNQNMIGYVDTDMVDETVKVILIIQ